MMVSVQLSAQYQDVRFKNFGIEDGLSQSTVSDFVKDSKGFLWMTTADGLNRFDGKNFTIFKYSKTDTTSLADNLITRLLLDDQRLWIGTANGGLHMMDLTTEKIRRLKSPTQIPASFIRGIAKSPNGIIWVASWDGGVFYHDPIENKSGSLPLFANGIQQTVMSAIVANGDSILALSNNGYVFKISSVTKSWRMLQLPKYLNRLVAMSVDENQTLWLGGFESKIWSLSVNGGNVTEYKLTNEMSTSGLWAILPITPDSLWVGTSNGLYFLNPKQKIIRHFEKNNQQSGSLPDNEIRALYEDDDQNLWLGSRRGFSVTSKRLFRFPLLRFSQLNIQTNLNYNQSILTAKNGTMWLGTYDAGLFIWNTRNKQVNKIKLDPDIKMINCLFESSDGTIWVGTGSRWIFRKKRDQNFQKYALFPEGTNNFFTSFHEDSNGFIWVTSYGRGIFRIDPKTMIWDEFYKYGTDAIPMELKRLMTMSFDQKDTFYVGTDGDGLFTFSPSSGLINKVRFQSQENSNPTRIYSIHYVNAENIYLGTYGDGLKKYNSLTGELISMFENTVGLESIYGLLPGKNNDLWISTNSGLFHAYFSGDKIYRYQERDGLQSNEFNFGAYAKNDHGVLFFGGINGVTIVNTNEIQEEPLVGNIVITSIETFFKPKNFQTPISELKEIIFNEDETVFSIGFGRLDLPLSDRIHYAYKLEGFDQHWNEVGASRQAIYTNISPGKYFLTIKSTNAFGEWMSDELKIPVIIETSLFKSSPMVFIYLFSLLSILYFIYKRRNG